MDKEYAIQLSGPFEVTDSLGRNWKVDSVRIFDEGWGGIDVYVAFASAEDEDRLHEDAAVIRQILSRLRALGYVGPDFGPAAEELQDCGLIVLEAPEEFEPFAASLGWRNLAEDYLDGEPAGAAALHGDTTAHAIYAALMQKLRTG
jgi:hypothetical protein